MKNILLALCLVSAPAVAHPGAAIHVHLADVALLAVAAVFLLGVALGVKELLARR